MLLHIRQYVTVDVQSNADGGVSKQFTHNLRIDAAIEQQHRSRMPQITKADPGRAPFSGAPEIAAEGN